MFNVYECMKVCKYIYSSDLRNAVLYRYEFRFLDEKSLGPSHFKVDLSSKLKIIYCSNSNYIDNFSLHFQFLDNHINNVALDHTNYIIGYLMKYNVKVKPNLLIPRHHDISIDWMPEFYFEYKPVNTFIPNQYFDFKFRFSLNDKFSQSTCAIVSTYLWYKYLLLFSLLMNEISKFFGKIYMHPEVIYKINTFWLNRMYLQLCLTNYN